MAAHEYDPDDNFDHAFHAQVGVDDEAALEDGGLAVPAAGQSR